MMKYKKIKTLSGKLLGDQIYRFVTTEAGTLIKLSIFRWSWDCPICIRVNGDRLRRLPHFTPLDADGNEMLTPKFNFQNTREERNLYEENRKITAAQTAKELAEVSLRVSDKAIQMGVRKIIVTKLTEGINTFLSLILEPGTVKALEPIVDFIADFFYTITFGIVWFIMRPFWLWYLSNQLESTIEHLHNPIVESPLHGFIDELIKSLS